MAAKRVAGVVERYRTTQYARPRTIAAPSRLTPYLTYQKEARFSFLSFTLQWERVQLYTASPSLSQLFPREGTGRPVSKHTPMRDDAHSAPAHPCTHAMRKGSGSTHTMIAKMDSTRCCHACYHAGLGRHVHESSGGSKMKATREGSPCANLEHARPLSLWGCSQTSNKTFKILGGNTFVRKR